MRKQQSKSDVARFNEVIQSAFRVGHFFGKNDRVLVIDESPLLLVVRNDVPVFFYSEGRLVPTLKLLLQQPLLKRVVVDRGAVRALASGADVMRPGVVDLDRSIALGEYVVVLDVVHKKPLCVAQALFSGEEMFRESQGRMLKNLHHVGDAIWNFVP